MTTDHVIATLAHPRSVWPTKLARWATSGAIPVELITCLSVEELHAVIASGRRLSAVMLDGASSRVDAQLVAALTGATMPVGVDAQGTYTDWEGLGVSASLVPSFDRDDLMTVLARSGVAGTSEVAPSVRHTLTMVQRRASVVAVCGSGGSGASVVAMAIAQGLAARSDDTTRDPDRRTLLVDGSARGHQALYHHTGDVLPGLADLVERIRRRPVDAADLDELTYRTDRGYELLLGVPTPRDGATMGQRDLAGVLDAAVTHNDVVVVDHDGDLPLGHLSGALTTVADVWVIVTGPGIKGLHDGLRSIHEACRSSVTPASVLVVCNRVRRRDPARLTFPLELSRMVQPMGLDVAPALVLPEANLESIHHDAKPIPTRIVRPVAARVRRLIDHSTRAGRTAESRPATATIRTATA